MLYLKLAVSGIQKNRRLYVPYLLTCIGMVMMFYILSSLIGSPIMDTMRGGESMECILMLGQYVIGIFSVIFLFYTNSFLIRRRNREFGLYNILGMNKGNISRILILEHILTAFIALTIGIFSGILFSKLAELVLLKLMNGKAGYSIYLTGEDVALTVMIYGIIFLAVLAVSLGRVRFTRPLDLLKSEATGEKPPRANWILAISGVIILACAYYLAVTIEEPITAIIFFFLAVILVIIATYLIFIAGSVAVCRIMQRNKRYYYHPVHFVSVSSMVYRMKRNGAGLASICILSTMVLVMLSSTSSLYANQEKALHTIYPRDIVLSVRIQQTENWDSGIEEVLEGLVSELPKEKIFNQTCSLTAETSGLLEEGGHVNMDMNSVNLNDQSIYEDLRSFYIFPLDVYNQTAEKKVELKEDELLIYSSETDYPYESLSFGTDTPRRVLSLEKFDCPIGVSNAVPWYVVFTPDFLGYVKELEKYANFYGDPMVSVFYCNTFDLDMEEKEINAYVGNVNQRISQLDLSQYQFLRIGVSSLAGERDSLLALNGSLLFLGMILSLLFICAMVLIIYYKQISEAYEDQSRFEIMRKVGMTDREIRRSINSQVLTVFFLPLIMAGIHLAFALPLVWRVLRLMGYSDLKLMIEVNIVCFLIFGLFYVMVYRITSGVYYRIVKGIREG